MPSNKDLIEDILAIDPDAKVEGLKNEQLYALLKELRAKQYVASKQPEIEKAATVEANLIDVLTQGKGLQISAPVEHEPEPEPEYPATQIPTYRVVEGRAITSKRGILGPGSEVRPEFFVNGEAVIAELLEKGTIK